MLLEQCYHTLALAKVCCQWCAGIPLTDSRLSSAPLNTLGVCRKPLQTWWAPEVHPTSLLIPLIALMTVGRIVYRVRRVPLSDIG